MKKLLLVIIALSFTTMLHAQEPELRKGYVGLGLGPAFCLGSELKDALSTGIQFNINFGYMLSRHVGLASSVMVTSFDSKYNDNSIGLSGFSAGPIFSTATHNGKVEFDFRPTIGFGIGTVTVKTDYGKISEDSKTSFMFSLGGALRWNCARWLSLSAGLDYIYCKPEDVDLSSIGIMFGINYRIK